MAKTCLITGGAGFIGSHLAKRLVKCGYKVIVLDDLSTGSRDNLPEKAVFYKVDISNTASVKKLKIPAKVDYFFHLAAQSSGEASFDDPLRDINVNYLAVYNMLKLAQQKKCGRFIFSSSMSVYGQPAAKAAKIGEDQPCNPASYYGCNKLASERLIAIFSKQSGMKYTVLRLFNVYGPGQNMRNMKQGMASIYLSYISCGQPITVKGSLKRFRDFIYIEDVIRVLLGVMDNRRAYGQIFNVGTSVKTTVKELLCIILRLYEKDDFREWVRLEDPTKGDITGIIADIAKLKRTLGWRPKYNLTAGLALMKNWLDKTGGR